MSGAERPAGLTAGVKRRQQRRRGTPDKPFQPTRQLGAAPPNPKADAAPSAPRQRRRLPTCPVVPSRVNPRQEQQPPPPSSLPACLSPPLTSLHTHRNERTSSLLGAARLRPSAGAWPDSMIAQLSSGSGSSVGCRQGAAERRRLYREKAAPFA